MKTPVILLILSNTSVKPTEPESTAVRHPDFVDSDFSGTRLNHLWMVAWTPALLCLTLTYMCCLTGAESSNSIGWRVSTRVKMEAAPSGCQAPGRSRGNHSLGLRCLSDVAAATTRMGTGSASPRLILTRYLNLRQLAR